MNIEKNLIYNDSGQQLILKVQLKYEDLEVFEFPRSCSKCPVGFSHSNDCGRNIPFKTEDYQRRPETCKLKKISYDELLKSALL